MTQDKASYVTIAHLINLLKENNESAVVITDLDSEQEYVFMSYNAEEEGEEETDPAAGENDG